MLPFSGYKPLTTLAEIYSLKRLTLVDSANILHIWPFEFYIPFDSDNDCLYLQILKKKKLSCGNTEKYVYAILHQTNFIHTGYKSKPNLFIWENINWKPIPTFTIFNYFIFRKIKFAEMITFRQ